MTEKENQPMSSSSSAGASSSGSNGGGGSSSSYIGAGKRANGVQYPNPPETSIPEAATLRDQWKFAIRQYSKWYSHAWGTAILAGGAFFALGWIIKGSNPLPSLQSHRDANSDTNTERPNPNPNPSPS